MKCACGKEALHLQRAGKHVCWACYHADVEPKKAVTPKRQTAAVRSLRERQNKKLPGCE